MDFALVIVSDRSAADPAMRHMWMMRSSLDDTTYCSSAEMATVVTCAIIISKEGLWSVEHFA